MKVKKLRESYYSKKAMSDAIRRKIESKLSGALDNVFNHLDDGTPEFAQYNYDWADKDYYGNAQMRIFNLSKDIANDLTMYAPDGVDESVQKNKRKIREDIFSDVVGIDIPSAIVGIDIQDETTEGPEIGMDTGIVDMLLHLITDENEAIQQYNSARATLATDAKYSDFIKVMDDISTEELNHVGQLQTLLKKLSPNASAIEAGEVEAEQNLTEDVSPRVNVVESYRLTESKETPYFKAFITNLGKYNEGDLVGEWVEFPIDEDEFEEVLHSIGVSDEPDEDGNYYEEWFVTDYECNIPSFEWQSLGEYPSYEKLQEFGELVDSIDDVEAVSNAMEVVNDLEEAIEGLANGDINYYPGIMTNQDLGYMIVDDIYGDITELGKDTIESYFDYEALGRDLSFDSYESEDDEGNEIEVSAGEYWCGDENATDTEIGEAYVDEVGFEGVSNPEYYFDYERFGRDASFDGFTLTSDGCIEYR